MDIPLAACTIEKIRKKITEYLHISKKSSTFAVAFAEWRSARPVPQAGFDDVQWYKGYYVRFWF